MGAGAGPGRGGAGAGAVWGRAPVCLAKLAKPTLLESLARSPLVFGGPSIAWGRGEPLVQPWLGTKQQPQPRPHGAAPSLRGAAQHPWGLPAGLHLLPALSTGWWALNLTHSMGDS